MVLNEGITLFATDMRPRYTNDVLTVLSLPEGAHYQFRYESRYIPAEIRYALRDGITGNRAIVAFRSQASPTGDEAIIPVRFVRFTSLEQFADFYILHYRVEDYCRPTYSVSTLDQIHQASRIYLDGLPDLVRQLPVQRGFAQLVQTEQADQSHGWLDVARSLSRHPTYQDTHFMRVSSFTSQADKPLDISTDGTYKLDEDKLYHLGLQYYAEKFGIGDSNLHVSTDPSVIRSASTTDWVLDSRYDSITLWLHVKSVPGSTKTEIRVDVTDRRTNSPQTHVTLPIIIRRSHAILTQQTILSALSGALLASPSILGEASPLELRLTLALLGAVLLAFVTNVYRKANN